MAKQPDEGEKGEPQEVLLTANQQAVFDAREDRISKNLVDNPEVVIPAESLQRMTFEETALPVILESVAKAYGVEIEFNRTVLSTCRMTTYLSTRETLHDRLGIICSAIGATYTVEGTRIIINSPGCEPTE